MSAFDDAWDLLKDQTPDFNPGETEDGWFGNIPENAEEAYEAAKRGDPVYHCPSCDAYLDKPICYGHAYGGGFKQPLDALLNPTGHAHRRPMGLPIGQEKTIPPWEMSARERFGMGYHPVPDPSDPPKFENPDDEMLDMVSGVFGGLSDYQSIDEPNKPSFREFLQNRRMDEARKQRLGYLLWLADYMGLSTDELHGMFLQPEYEAIDIDEEIMDDLRGIRGD